MNTIPELIEQAYLHWDEAGQVAQAGIELESRSRLAFARKFLRRAVELDPTGHPEWYVALAFANFRESARNLNESGEEALTAGIEASGSDYLKASYIAFMEDPRMTESLIADTGRSADINVQFALGSSLVWIGRSEEALNVLRTAIRSFDGENIPYALDIYCGSMNWLKAQGFDIDSENEILYYLNLLEKHQPRSYNARALTIQAWQILKDWEKVKETALKALEIFPDEETTMLALGQACEKLGNEERAIHWYNRAIGAKPSFVRARMNLAAIYERRKDLEMAEEIMREIPSAYPDYAMGRVSLSFFLDRAGKSEEAAKVFSQAYARLRPHEKAQVEQNPQARKFLEREKKLELKVL